MNLTHCRFSTWNMFLMFNFLWIFMFMENKMLYISQLSVTVSSWVRHYRSSSSGKLQSFDIKPLSFDTQLQDAKQVDKMTLKKKKNINASFWIDFSALLLYKGAQYRSWYEILYSQQTIVVERNKSSTTTEFRQIFYAWKNFYKKIQFLVFFCYCCNKFIKNIKIFLKFFLCFFCFCFCFLSYSRDYE